MDKIKDHYQNVIFGFGKGGKTLAAFLAAQGQEVALIERSKFMYGGTCINVACIPTKSLIANAERGVAYGEAVQIKGELTSLLRAKNYENLAGKSQVTVITGEASFVSDRTVRVTFDDSREQVTIRGDRVFINAGTEPRIPPIPGISNSSRIFTSASLMEQSRLPEKLVIVGGGFIGLEFADMYAKFGSQVTLLDRGSKFLPEEDDDIAEEVFKVLTSKGIRILLGVEVQQFGDTKRGIDVRFNQGEEKIDVLQASAVLIATGRKPNTVGLNLAAAGVETDERGFIRVNDRLQTSAHNVWAIGDINGGPQFTYISLDDFRIIRDQLFGGDYTSVTKRKLVATSVFISPPLAHIGLREKEGRAQGCRIKVARLPAAAIPRARILNNTDGLLKSVIDVDTNKILGCTLFCAGASEMINTVQVAMNAELDYRMVGNTIFTHPSMTEALNDLYDAV